jgi:hypothetical protein
LTVYSRYEMSWRRRAKVPASKPRGSIVRLHIGVDPIAAAVADIKRLLPLGVTEFQIDSVHGVAFQ